MLNIKSILHPTDFSAVSQAAFQTASILARTYGSHLLVLHVQAEPDRLMSEAGGMPPASLEVVQSRQQLENIQTSLPIRVERVLQHGNPAMQILALARNAPCQLIVMGGHGHSRLHNLLMGSVAAAVVRDAPCPVLTLTLPRSS